MSNLVDEFLFPPSLVVVALGNTSAIRNTYILALMLAAGLATYLFCRRHGLAFLPSLTAAVSFMLSGGLVQTAPSFMGQTVAALPCALLAASWFFDNPTWRRAAVIALIFATLSLASFPPLIVGMAALTATYVLIRLVLERSRRSAMLIRYTCAAALAIALVAFYYLPALYTIRAAPHVRDTYENAARETLPLHSVLQLASPSLMGGPYYFHQLVPSDSGSYLYYCGLVTLVLAAIAAVWGRSRKDLWLFGTLLSLAILAKILGVPGFQWIASLPVVKSVHIAAYYGILVDLCLAILAGIGIDIILTATTTRMTVLALCILFGIPAMIWAFAARHGTFEQADSWRWSKDYVWLLALCAVAAICFLLRLKASQPWQYRATAALLGLVALEGVINAYFPRQVRSDIWRRPPGYVTRMQQLGSERVLPIGVLTANTNAPYGIFSTDSLMAFNNERCFRIYQRYFEPGAMTFFRGSSRIPPEALLDRLNVGTVLTYTGDDPVIEAARRLRYTLDYSDGYAIAYRRPTLPRYFFSTDYVVAPPNAALRMIATVLPSRRLILEDAPDFPPSPLGNGRVSVRDFGLNSVRLDATSDRPGLVYCAESHWDGWSAFVDGRPTTIRRANYGFRAVDVPSGSHMIELRYVPPGLRTGTIISVLAAAIIAVLLAGHWHRERPSASPA